ncbi:MAG: 16S rRNA (uracil(1498)-N(3))-methyltransferase [Ignavibacteriales bacterium]
MAHLSNIELFYTPPVSITGNELILQDDEFHHAVNVMRSSVGNTLYVTDGEGTIYRSEILKIKKNDLAARIVEKFVYGNKAENIFFCIPVLKNPDRLKFAIEKSVELGITNFILFHSKHSLSKKMKPEKFQNTALSAMKQSLRSFLPKIISSGFEEIINLKVMKILFAQSSEKAFEGNNEEKNPVYFLFGPEGGFDNKELNSVDSKYRYNLSTNRLRSETAIVKCASMLKL